MGKVAYQNADEDGTFSFHRADGKLVEITHAKAFETDDPRDIAYLDQVEHVRRVKKDKEA